MVTVRFDRDGGMVNSCMCDTICTAGFCTALSAALSAPTSAAAAAAGSGIVVKGVPVLKAAGHAIYCTSCAVSILLVSGDWSLADSTPFCMEIAIHTTVKKKKKKKRKLYIEDASQ